MAASRLFQSIIITAIISFFVIVVGMAATYYVDQNHPSASNSNPGTEDLPWLTIQHASDTVVAGDTVFIKDGLYNEHVHTINGGSPSSHIVYSAYPGDTPVVDGTGVVESRNGIIVDQDYIKLLGLAVRDWEDAGIWVENAGYVEISDCEVYEVTYGIGFANGAHDFELNRVEMHLFDWYGFDASPSGGADCYNGTFNDCVAHTARDPQQNVDGFALAHGTQHDFTFNRCEAYGVFDGFDISSPNSTLNRCSAHDNTNGGYKLWADDVTLVNCLGYHNVVTNVELDWGSEGPGRTTLQNCTFMDAGEFNVWIENAADTLFMYNCILAGGDNIGLAFEQTGVGNYHGDYNLFHNDNSSRAVVVGYEDEFSLSQIESGEWTTYSGQDTHSLVANTATEIFLNPASFDLHLLANSPAVDNGTSTGAPSEDFEGNPRPSGSGYDIGAYEFQTTGIGDDAGSSGGIPRAFMLSQNYPNPFNPSTTIEFTVPGSGVSNPGGESVESALRVYDVRGRLVRTLFSGDVEPGRHTIQWDGRTELGETVSSGIYLYRLDAGDYSSTRRLVVMK